MAAAGEAIRELVTGPVRAARVVHAGPHAVYYQVTASPEPSAGGRPKAGEGVFALLGPQAVRVPIGILAAAPLPVSTAGVDSLRVEIGDGAVIVDGSSHRVLRWWPTRVVPHDQLETPVAMDQPSFQLIMRERLGLGEGLTPEGDDELAGMLVALHAYGRRAEARELAAAVLTVLDANPNATTAVSAALLRAACDGHAVPEVARFVAEGCATGTPAHRELLAVGHTSGEALARGALRVHRHHIHLEEAAPV